MLSYQGVLIIIGVYNKPIKFDLYQMLSKEATLHIGLLYLEKVNIKKLINLVSKQKIDFSNLFNIFSFNFENIEKAYKENRINRKVFKTLVTFENKLITK